MLLYIYGDGLALDHRVPSDRRVIYRLNAEQEQALWGPFALNSADRKMWGEALRQTSGLPRILRAPDGLIIY